MKKFTASRLLIAAAIAWISIGSFALASHHKDNISAIQYAGVVLLLDCLLLLVVSYSCNATDKEKKWIIAEGVVNGLFSILLLLDPVFAYFVLPFLISPWIVTRGLVTMIASLSLKNSILGWMGDLTGGLLLICCGLLIPHQPQENPFGINVIIGAIGWTIGALYAYDAYRFRKIKSTFHQGV
jgi:uncharacterized membrane protein HdeD (DUF308 family)